MSSMNRQQTRMRSEDRRELILAAATRVFGDSGYVGTTTAEIARAAEVSQPYVVRMFGTKEKLFIEVLGRALDLLMQTFRRAVEEAQGEDLHHRIGLAYVELAETPGLLLSLMHGFVLGNDPVIGREGRRGFMVVYRFLRHEAGFSAEEANQFLSGGMLINTMIGLRMAEDLADPDVRELMETAFPTKLDAMRGLLGEER